MVTPFQPQAIDGPPAQPPVYGLLIAADVVNDGEQWHAGVKWRPEQIGGGGTVGLECDGGTDDLGQATNPVNITAEPFVVWAEDHCAVLTGSKALLEYEARARRQLNAIQSYEIAHEFQLGAQRDADSLHNVALKDATVIHPGAVSEVVAVSELEAALAQTFKGRRGMIHVAPQVFTILHSTFLLERAGQKWITAQGTVVVSDAGYTEEVNGFLWAYATGPVQVRLGEVDIPAPTLSRGAIDTSVNDVRVYAQREALVQVDGEIAGTAGAGTADAMFKIQLSTVPWAFSS